MAKESYEKFASRRNAEDKSKKSSGGTLFGKPKDEVIKHPGAFTAKAEKAK